MLKIKAEFAEALPPLRKEEEEALRAELLAKGIRDRIVVWKEFIADGHHRYAIAEAENLPFETTELPVSVYPDEASVIAWILDQQLARRNLTTQHYSYYRGKRLNVADSSQGKASETSKKATAKKVAEAAGVSVATVYADGELAKHVDALETSLKQLYLAGGMKVPKADLEKLASLTAAQQRKIELGVAEGKFQPAGKKSAWSVALETIDQPQPKKKSGGSALKVKAAFDPKVVGEAFQSLTKLVDEMHKAMPDKAARDAIQKNLNAAYKRFKEWAA